MEGKKLSPLVAATLNLEHNQQSLQEEADRTTLSLADHTGTTTPSNEPSLEKGVEKQPLPYGDEDEEDKKPDAAPATTPSEDQWITGPKLYAIVASVTLACFLILLDLSIIVTAVPRITTQFNSLPDVGWYGSSYQLAAASLQPLAGKIYSNFPAKISFLAFFFIFELGSLLCGVSTSSKMLIVSRAVAGIGAAGLINGALTILSVCIPLHKRPAFFGGMMGFAQMGLVIGPLLGGAFTQYTTWRWCFYINLPLGGIVFILLLLIQIPDTVKRREISIFEIIRTKLDLIGFALFAPAAIQFFLALDYGGHQYAWNSATIIGLFCGAGGTFIVFLVWEKFKGDNAMIPFSMFKHRSVWSSCIVILFFFGMLQLASYYLPIYFQSIKDATPMLSGVYMLPSIISQLIGALSSGVLVSKMGYYLPWIIASGVMTSVSNGLLSTFSPTTSAGKWIGYQILLGTGRGFGLQMPFIAVQNTLPPAFVPVSMALISFSQNFGGAVLLAIGETVLTNGLKSNVPKYAPDVDPAIIIAAGATGIRDVVSNSTQLAGVIRAYATSVDSIFYLAAACGCVVFVAGWGMGWKDIRKKEEAKPVEPPVKDGEV
ncbi:putative HC-toxin efflux carrier [Lipomyces orientalis]|uniref:HC-toxin efflux carrier n=1 Tax=Lipomyces orientalis TaxID=1233043 RepID=A0ACC3THM5_9ASCO